MKQRNPRVLAVGMMRAIAGNLRWLLSSGRWGQSQTVFDDREIRWRKRHPAEQIENQVEMWRELREYISDSMERLNGLDDLARGEIHRLMAEQARREEARRSRRNV